MSKHRAPTRRAPVALITAAALVRWVPWHVYVAGDADCPSRAEARSGDLYRVGFAIHCSFPLGLCPGYANSQSFGTPAAALIVRPQRTAAS